MNLWEGGEVYPRKKEGKKERGAIREGVGAFSKILLYG